jgi:hypothetical protein
MTEVVIRVTEKKSRCSVSMEVGRDVVGSLAEEISKKIFDFAASEIGKIAEPEKSEVRFFVNDYT